MRRHAAWILALQATTAGDAAGAHRWLCANGEDERLSVLPLFPMDVADETRLVAHRARRQRPRAGRRRARRRPNAEPSSIPRSPSITATAAHVSGVLDHDPVQLSKAVELFELGHRPLALAAALEDLGAVAVDNGETDQAVSRLQLERSHCSQTPAPSGTPVGCGAGFARSACDAGWWPPSARRAAGRR